MITQMQPAIKMALRVARQGSDYLKAHFERQEPSDKENSERERQLDRVEQAIYDNFVEQLAKAYKDHNIAPLNQADAGTYDKSWHIFPVLGRDNFLRGIPEFVLALAQKKNNRIESLLIVNPITGEEYSASRGHGAALNSRRVRVSEVRQLNSAALATNVLDQARKDDNPQLWGEMATVLATNSRIFRTSGCVVLDIARVSAGHLDAVIAFRPEAAEFDLGVALAMESGALTGDFSGNPSASNAKQLIVANPKLFRELLKELHPFRGRLPR